MRNSKLYVVGTPIGNRDDVTLRALALLRTIPVIFAEDTRECSKFLDLHGISAHDKTLQSYASHNMKAATDRAIAFLNEGKDVAFVSDRGTPGVSDPGSMLVERARREGFAVVPIPGVSALSTLLSVAGSTETEVLFIGFLPKEEKRFAEAMDGVEKLGVAFIFFESPQRVRKALKRIADRFPAGWGVLGREMTKIHETYARFVLSEIDQFELVEKGEMAIFIHPGPARAGDTTLLDEAIRLRLTNDKGWAREVAGFLGLSVTDVYNALQERKRVAAR